MSASVCVLHVCACIHHVHVSVCVHVHYTCTCVHTHVHTHTCNNLVKTDAEHLAFQRYVYLMLTVFMNHHTFVIHTYTCMTPVC